MVIPDSVTWVDDCPFVCCFSLEKFYGRIASDDNRCCLRSGGVSLVAFAPAGLTSYSIPNEVHSIGQQVFGGCNELTSITIPANVNSIGDYAFYKASNLKEVYCLAQTPPTINFKVFEENAIDRKIYVPMSSVEAYKTDEGWSNYADNIVGYNF